MTDLIKRDDAPEPCPFCRSPAKTQELVEDLWVVWCVECKAQMENFATEAEAIAAWNTRDLPAVTVGKPTEAQIASACLSYDHSFGLMDGPERVALMHQAREWFHAWRKEYVK